MPSFSFVPGTRRSATQAGAPYAAGGLSADASRVWAVGPQYFSAPAGGRGRGSENEFKVAISIILPTYNERENLPVVVAQVARALGAAGDWELVVVDDDSPDGTWQLAGQLAEVDPRIRVHRRQDRRGLSSAIVEGLSLARGERLVVMDADLQHDVAQVPALVAALDVAPVAIGTRYAGNGGVGEWSRGRTLLSRLATVACQVALGVAVSDPMSGFFAIRRETFRSIEPQLNPRGYKILMEILHLTRPAQTAEVPYVFAPRRAGESKLCGRVVWDFGYSLVELVVRSLFSPRFLKYALVGLSGIAVQGAARGWLWSELGPAGWATELSIATAAVSNYAFNNVWTFRDRMHRGAVTLARGLALFLLVSGTGALINHAVGRYLQDATGLPLLVTAAVGLGVGTLWNFYLNLDLTWRGHALPE